MRLATMGLVAALSLGAPAQALDLSAMTDAERAAFRAEVRAYLLDNPEVLMEAISALEQKRNDAQAEADAGLVAAHADALFNDGRSWIGGNPEGDLTIVEFMDYQCTYCKRAYPDVDALLKEDGHIRFIVKEFPILGDPSVLAARFAIAVRRIAGADAYESVHDALMTLRAEIGEEALRGVSDRLGLATDDIMAAMDAPEIDEELAANTQLARTLGINGTPGFVFESELVRGYVPLDTMRQIVAKARG